MKKVILAMSVVLWSVIFLPNGQYMVVDDGETGSTTVSPSQGGSYRGYNSDGSQDVVAHVGNNSVYQAPVYQPPQPNYQQPSNVPDFQMKSYNW